VKPSPEQTQDVLSVLAASSPAAYRIAAAQITQDELRDLLEGRRLLPTPILDRLAIAMGRQPVESRLAAATSPRPRPEDERITIDD
jgi:hypothetical protein